MSRGWSQEGLAARLRVKADRDGRRLPDTESVLRNVKRWERGECQPNDLNAGLLADVFGIPGDGIGAPTSDLLPPDVRLSAYGLPRGSVDWRSLVIDLRRTTDLLCSLYAVRPPLT